MFEKKSKQDLKGMVENDTKQMAVVIAILVVLGLTIYLGVDASVQQGLIGILVAKLGLEGIYRVKNRNK